MPVEERKTGPNGTSTLTRMTAAQALAVPVVPVSQAAQPAP